MHYILYKEYHLSSIIGLEDDSIINPEIIDLKTSQLINICRLFFMHKSLIILDETISQVDLKTCEQVMQMINQYLGNSIIINTTHQHHELLNCKCIYELKNGILYEKD